MSVGLALSGVLVASCSSAKHDPAAQPAGSSSAAAKPSEETLAATPTAASKPDVLLIVPGERVGIITRALDRRTIDRMYPRDEVTHDMCSTGEEEESPCSHITLRGAPVLTVIYDPQLRAERVLVHAAGFRTRDGLSVGMTLAELVARNAGRPLTVSALSGDLGGLVVDTHAGTIDTAALSIYLGCQDHADRPCPPGDGELSSSNSAIRSADLRVRLLDVALDRVHRIAGGEGEDDPNVPVAEPELTLATLRTALQQGDWATVRRLSGSAAIVKDLRRYRDDFVASFHPECDRKRNKVVCGWNGDGTSYELTMEEEAAGWLIARLTIEPVE